jgi:ABC-type Fe3+/spermidine/putrescine transport system ATPase subunit
MKETIALEDVGLVLDGRTILDGISLAVAPGDVVAVLGPSGSGKSSLLRLVLGFLAPTRGRVRLDGQTVSETGRVLIPPEERRLAVVFQDLALWPHLTVEQHLSFALAATNLTAQERERRIAQVIERLGLGGAQGRLPGGLSGGERQRVAIGRALVLRPRAILLDEPLASLDVALRREMLAMFRSLLREEALTAILVSHDLREAERLAARIAVIEGGRLVQHGMPADLAAAPATPFVRALVADVEDGS